MADRRTKKTAKQIFGYARLNFHMGMRQGKNLAVLLCMGCFLLYYLGGIRGYLASAEETVMHKEETDNPGRGAVRFLFLLSA